MSEASIRFAPDILRRLGEELNPTTYQGILELVKNAYDADAEICKIELIDTDKTGGSLVISDDGDGMTELQVAESWLVLGRSDKSSSQVTRRGRTPSGSKGLGRLAALRMGSTVQLETRPKKQPTDQVNLKIDWAKFDTAAHVEDVTFNITTKKVKGVVKAGTEVTIDDLREPITRLDVKKLARELILLADPFDDNRYGFKPTLIAPEYKDLESLVKTRYFDDAEYHLVASVDKKGRASAKIYDWKQRLLFQANHEKLAAARRGQPYNCPALEFQLWVFILDGDTFSTRNSSVQEVREWLKVFGGVHLYQNNLRVSPYGDPGNDWLDINLQRARNPEERPSTNTLIGRIVVKDKQQLLVQKTDRSGFIETEVFGEVRTFAQDALEWMGKRRLEEALKRRAKVRAASLAAEKPSKKTLEKAIAKVPSKIRPEVKKAAEAREREHSADIDRLRREIQLYRTLSTAGITAATFAHESSGNPIKVITNSINSIQTRAKKKFGRIYESLLKSPIETVQRAVRGLAVLGIATLKLLEHEKRRTGKAEIHKIISEVLNTFKPFTLDRNVKVLTEFAPGAPYLRCSEAAIESIITNLINNSLTATEISDKDERIIKIKTEIFDDVLQLRVQDNGNGIVGVPKEDTWLPGVTTRANGTGLGLTIVRDTVSDLGGTVAVNETCSLGGAEFIIDIPILGK